MKKKYIYSPNELFEKGYSAIKEDTWFLLFIYYCGTIPFCIFFLFFWFEFSFNPYASNNLYSYSLIGILLFGWMKYFQSLYCTSIYNRLKLNSDYKIKLSIKEFLFQLGIQPIGVICFLISSIIVFPMGYCYFYFNNLMISKDDRKSDQYFERLKVTSGDNKLKDLSPLHFLLYSQGLYLIILINMLSFIFVFPHLLKMFLGLETIFLKNTLALLNSTTFITAFVLSYLVIDPFIKSTAAYIYFIKASRPNGEDLLVKLQKLALPAIMIFAIFTFSLKPIQANEPKKVQNKQLETSFNKTINQKKYVWRKPRSQKNAVEENSYLKQFFEWLENFVEGKTNDADEQSDANHNSSSSFGDILNFILYIVVGVILLIIILLIIKNIRLSSDKEIAVTIKPKDTNEEKNIEEEVLEYEEEEWIQLINSYINKQDYKSAIRHIYLHALQSLAEKNYLLIKKHKTNKQYKLEVSRRTKHLPNLKSYFQKIVTNFENVWFGLYAIDETETQETIEYLKNLKEGISLHA
ncbi:MAG: hypothetical protein COA79_02725 [Planctomycetota bacterium]|nr:MAG: hypothetical protein COA79_02725 [Planctomycetota bacterium]